MTWLRRKPHPPAAVSFDGGTVTLDPAGWIHCSCGTDFIIGTDVSAAASAWREHANNSACHKPKEAA